MTPPRNTGQVADIFVPNSQHHSPLATKLASLPRSAPQSSEQCPWSTVRHSTGCRPCPRVCANISISCFHGYSIGHSRGEPFRANLCLWELQTEHYPACSALFWHPGLKKERIDTLQLTVLCCQSRAGKLANPVSSLSLEYVDPDLGVCHMPRVDISVRTPSQMMSCLSLLLHVSSSCLLLCQWCHCYYWAGGEGWEFSAWWGGSGGVGGGRLLAAYPGLHH